MCRLFGLHVGTAAVTATFWLLDAPDSLARQSHQNPDGAGIGVFAADGAARVDKQPIAAWDDCEFANAARDLTGTPFVAHVRHASTGARTQANTHPFEQDGRLLAHNGVIGGLHRLNARLDELGFTDLVHGDTDSERLFALITAETVRHSGNAEIGLHAAVGWIADNLPLYCANLVLATATDLWALRYPDTNELWVLDRSTEGQGAERMVDMRTDRIRARSVHLADHSSVIVASEPMDEDPRWILLNPGELVHVTAELQIESTIPFPDPPRHRLDLNDLSATAAQSQRTTP